MNKILNYIKNGKGIGGWFILALSVLYILIGAFKFDVNKPKLVSVIQAAADQVLPIKIQNGVLTQPAQSRRQAILEFSDDAQNYNIRSNDNNDNSNANTQNNQNSMVFVVDPTISSLENEEVIFPGIYLTKNAAFLVNNDEIRIKPYSQDVEIQKADYSNEISAFLTALQWFIIGFGIIFLFLYYLIGVLFFSFCTSILTALTRRNMSFDSKMRLNTICMIVISLVSYILMQVVGISLHYSIFFALMILAELTYLVKLPKPEPASESQSEDKK